MQLQEFAPATTWIPNEIPIENLNWNAHSRRSKLFDAALRNAPATVYQGTKYLLMDPIFSGNLSHFDTIAFTLQDG